MWAQFVQAVHFIRLFANLKSVEISFRRHCCVTPQSRSPMSDVANDMDPEFHYWLLWTVFSCLDNSWSLAESRHVFQQILSLKPPNQLGIHPWGEPIDTEPFIKDLFARIAFDAAKIQQPKPITIKQLWIHNLSDHHDNRLASTETMKRVMSSVVDLKLHLNHPDHVKHPRVDWKSKLDVVTYSCVPALRQTWITADTAKHLKFLEISSSCSRQQNCEPKLNVIHDGAGFLDLQSRLSA
ncbi:hypothetical protein F5Y16DRAFT_392532 [Xylariaceae sp. FL0255]|nr:hypothetical protein F5Y16DRAFT_392532 [Xylariaceae sp. FL0255]